MTINLRSRLRQIETKQWHGERPMSAILIRTQSDDGRDRQIAEHMVAGTYRLGWPLLILRASPLPGGNERP
ncbi:MULTISPECIES: hypothetical protein [unclassified Methylobacterium]|jgi:hypothetical protein|uniref:hypothetical protein n=1 Tax=unclassified Methylobacterium TaxID=2615210 RepID=UPI001FB9A8DB|nr:MULTISPECIES: hypothetical protein [unclassified Methylobacterium]